MARKPEIKIKEYKNAKDFDKDAQKMLKDGWEIKEQTQGSTHVNWGRTLFSTVATGGLNMLTPKVGGASFTKGKVTVTWVRGEEKKKCPQCAEQVLKEAKVCRYCQHTF
jgi:hypothetical protein